MSYGLRPAGGRAEPSICIARLKSRQNHSKTGGTAKRLVGHFDWLDRRRCKAAGLVGPALTPLSGRVIVTAETNIWDPWQAKQSFPKARGQSLTG
jgi:hypothetical protein